VCVIVCAVVCVVVCVVVSISVKHSATLSSGVCVISSVCLLQGMLQCVL